jgi:hypothetical protein
VEAGPVWTTVPAGSGVPTTCVESIIGGIGVPAGGVEPRPQWKMRVVTARARLPPMDGGSLEASPASMMVITSPVSSAWTW